MDRLEEAVRIIRLLMDEGHGSFQGRYYRLDDAYLAPRPVQEPRIPLLIAAHRPRMLAIAARYADQWDTFAEMPGAATEGVSEDVAEQLGPTRRGVPGRRPRPVHHPPLDLDQP